MVIQRRPRVVSQTPAEQVTLALHALRVTATLVAELNLGPQVAGSQQRALNTVLIAGAELEALRRDLQRIERAAAKRRRAGK